MKLIILPFLESLMIALSQMYLSIVFSAIYSIIILLIESIVTLFFNNEILFSNCFLCGRNNLFIENGSDTWQLLVCVVAEIVKVIHSHYFFCLLF